MHRFVAAATAVLLVVTVALSDEFVGVISKFEDGKITVTKFKKGEKPEPETIRVSKKAKFMKAKFNKEDKKIETDGELEGGKDAFAKKVEEAAKNKDKGKGFGGGVFAQIVTEGEGDKARVTEIRVFPAFKGKFKKKDAD